MRDAERELASRASAALARAGLDARQRGDAAGAANLLSRALELLPAYASDRGELLLALGDSLRWPLGEWKEAAAVFEDALAEAEASGERGLAWEATLQRSWLESVMSPGMRSTEQYLREAEQAAAELKTPDHERGLARAWLAVATFRLWLGQGAAAAEAAERAAAFAHRAGDWHLERASLNWWGWSLCAGPTPASEGIRRCEEILARTDDIGLRSFMRASLSRLHAMLGHAGESRRLHELALADAEELGHKLQIAAVEGLIFADAETLEPVEAERRLRRVLALREKMADRGIRSTVAAMLARILLAQDRYDEAERYAALSASLAPPDDYDPQATIRAVRARVLAHRGDFEEAESLAHEAVAIADGTDDLDSRAWLRYDLAKVLSLAAKVDEARSVLKNAVSLAEQKEDLVLVERARARLAELQ